MDTDLNKQGNVLASSHTGLGRGSRFGPCGRLRHRPVSALMVGRHTLYRSGKRSWVQRDPAVAAREDFRAASESTRKRA
jgi:hypothetical protein